MNATVPAAKPVEARSGSEVGEIVGDGPKTQAFRHIAPRLELAPSDAAGIARSLADAERGVIICGPQPPTEPPPNTRLALAALAAPAGLGALPPRTGFVAALSARRQLLWVGGGVDAAGEPARGLVRLDLATGHVLGAAPGGWRGSCRWTRTAARS